ncbi:uncharacterized protein LOC111252469 isoform X1 [Varroa destructor]|uniref:Uncharacterized protein n=1 Tax=Varroa destructor TaxID=109461 RepID=A0A7M7KFV0_VARDE|nr:uncharacterized protein LOC111252469 isoform X1 [Varroa destructor]
MSSTTTNANSSAAVRTTATTTSSIGASTTATRRGGHPSRQKRFGPAPLASFEDLPTDDQDSSPENNEPATARSQASEGSTQSYHQYQQQTVIQSSADNGAAVESGLNWNLRLDLGSARSGHQSGSRGDSELSTPVAPDSDIVSQITITPTADSRNVSPLQGFRAGLVVTDPLATADYHYCHNPTTGTKSSLTTSVTEESSYRDEEEEAADVVDGPGKIQNFPPVKDVFKVTNAEESAEKEVHEMDNRSRHTPEGQPPFQEIMADQVAVTHAMIHEKNCQIRLPHEDSSIDQSEGSGFPGQKFSGATITASMASDTAITSEAILESLLKFEEERIPLSARLERSCQSIADIPSASHSRKNSSSVPQRQQTQQDQPISSLAEAGDAPFDTSPTCKDRSQPEGSQLLPAGSTARTNNGVSDRESDTDYAPERIGSPDADDDGLADLSSPAGASATRRRRRKLRPQTSDDRFESLRLLPAQDSVDVEDDDDYELQLLSLHSCGPEVQIDEAPTEKIEDENAKSRRDDNIAIVAAPRTPQKQTVAPSHQRQQLVTIPLERPRSTTPINVAPLEAYIQQQQQQQPTGEMPKSGASQGYPSSGASGVRSPDRLKLTLPGQHAGGNLAKSPRKGSLRNWEEFCEEALQHSPRTRSKSDAAALGQRFFPDPLEFSPASPPRPPDTTEDEIQSPSDYQDPFRRRLTCSCKCRTCACLCGGCDCDCHFYTQKVFESHLNDTMSHIVEINGTPGSPREDEQSLLSPEEAAVQGACLCECHTLPRDTSCLLTAPLLVAQSSLDSC